MNNALAQPLVTIAAMIAIFYFVAFRPQQVEKKRHEESLMAIKKGDEIVTAGGIIGDVVHVKTVGAEGAATLADRITIRSGESRLVIERGRISRVVAASALATTAKPAASGSPS